MPTPRRVRFRGGFRATPRLALACSADRAYLRAGDVAQFVACEVRLHLPEPAVVVLEDRFDAHCADLHTLLPSTIFFCDDRCGTALRRAAAAAGIRKGGRPSQNGRSVLSSSASVRVGGGMFGRACVL